MKEEKRIAMNKATKRILDLYASTGMAIDPFEKAVRLTEGTIKNLKNGRNNASADTICRVAEYFEVSVDYIMGYTDFPQCPTSWWILRRTLITLNKSLSALSQETGLPLEVFANWELGCEPDERTLWQICNTLQLKTNPFSKINKNISIKQPLTDITAIDNIKGLMSESGGIDIVEKLYAELQEKQKIFVIAWLIGYMQTQGFPVYKILGR